MLSKQLLQEATQLHDTILADRRYLHAHPGTGFDTSDALSYVKQQLTMMGYEPQECGKSGLVALVGKSAVNTDLLKSPSDGPANSSPDGPANGSPDAPHKVFLLRADMDALPIREESDVTFAATNGNMHACGHDMHTAMLLGAARLLKQHENEIPGTVKLMFQSAEEIFEGSRDMIQAGVLEHPSVDAAMMIHVMAGMPFPAGTAIVSAPGVSAPAADLFQIHVQGKGCHGSMPNTGIDPLTAAAHILIALQEIQSRELALGDQAVLTMGTMHAGTAPNVIPDTVTMGGSLRTYAEDTRAYIKQRVTEIAQGIAGSFRATAQVTFGSGSPTLFNDAEMADNTLRYLNELLGAGGVFSVAQLNAPGHADTKSAKTATKTAGSEDFAYISQEVPSIMVALAAGQPDKGYLYPQHHPQVRFDEEALSIGAAVYAYTAVRWLEEH